METWGDGAQRLLTLKISLRRLGGQPAVGASAQSVVLTASHSSFIEVLSTGLQVCADALVFLPSALRLGFCSLQVLAIFAANILLRKFSLLFLLV